MVKIEIACFNINSALIAQDNGADRIEFCAEMEAGGTTPSYDDISMLRKSISVDLNVMIRPRGGNFVYDNEELEQMKKDIIAIKKYNVDGFVFGILNDDHTVNMHQNKELVALAHPLPCTFHRAFDVIQDMEEGLNDLLECGFKTVLTSGCTSNVDLGLDSLKHLVQSANNKITIMPGGGLRSSNIGKLARETGAVYFHSSAITDGGDTASADEVKALKSFVL